MHRFIVVAAATLVASPVYSQIEFTVDPSRSSVDLELCVNALGTTCDSDSSPADGTLLIDVEGGENPTSLTFIDFKIDATEMLDINVNLGFTGSVSATGMDLSVLYAGPLSGSGPFMIDELGSFTATNLTIGATGNANYLLQGLVCTLAGGVCDDAIDLATVPPVTTPALTGTLTSDGFVYTLTYTTSTEIDLLADSPGLAVATIDTTIVATAPVPAEPCDGDTDSDQDVDIEDLLAVLRDFGKAPTLRTDFNNSGVVDIEDLLEVLREFGTGCE